MTIRGEYKNWVGKKFNKLTLTSILPKDMVVCVCECGKEITANIYNINSGHTKSCGCIMGTHKLSSSRINKIWKNIYSRCDNPNSTGYKNYGGRGISCDWTSFEDFYYDMIEGYGDSLSIDRIDVNGNYNKTNCRWSTNIEQGNNKRNNHIIEYDGVSKTISEWSRIVGEKQNTIYYRIKRGWEISRALNFGRKCRETF